MRHLRAMAVIRRSGREDQDSAIQGARVAADMVGNQTAATPARGGPELADLGIHRDAY
jgi:hypothetical protein